MVATVLNTSVAQRWLFNSENAFSWVSEQFFIYFALPLVTWLKGQLIWENPQYEPVLEIGKTQKVTELY